MDMNEIQELMVNVDKNKNGTIEFDEFYEMMIGNC